MKPTVQYAAPSPSDMSDDGSPSGGASRGPSGGLSEGSDEGSGEGLRGRSRPRSLSCAPSLPPRGPRRGTHPDARPPTARPQPVGTVYFFYRGAGGSGGRESKRERGRDQGVREGQGERTPTHLQRSNTRPHASNRDPRLLWRMNVTQPYYYGSHSADVTW